MDKLNQSPETDIQPKEIIEQIARNNISLWDKLQEQYIQGINLVIKQKQAVKSDTVFHIIDCKNLSQEEIDNKINSI